MCRSSGQSWRAKEIRQERLHHYSIVGERDEKRHIDCRPLEQRQLEVGEARNRPVAEERRRAVEREEGQERPLVAEREAEALEEDTPNSVG